MNLCPRCGKDGGNLTNHICHTSIGRAVQPNLIAVAPGEHCPTCGQPVRVVSADEGTSHYEAAAGYGAQIVALHRELGLLKRAAEDASQYGARSGYNEYDSRLNRAIGAATFTLSDTASAATEAREQIERDAVKPWREALAKALRLIEITEAALQAKLPRRKPEFEAWLANARSLLHKTGSGHDL